MNRLVLYGDLLKRNIEEVLTEHDPKIENLRELFELVRQNKGSKYERLKSLFRFLHCLVPVFSDPSKNLKHFRDTSQLPLNMDLYEFRDKIGKGGESDVYLLESKNPAKTPSLVIKIHLQKQKSREGLVEEAKRTKMEYEKVRNLYQSTPGVVPNEHILIAKDIRKTPLFKNGPGVVILQQYFGKNLKDIFSEIPTEELVQIMKKEPDFATEMLEFINTTIQHELETGEVVDFLGPKNLSVAEEGGRHKLIMLDPHVIYSSRTNNQKVREMLAVDLDYLKKLATVFKY